jgi:hypothetical protein
MSFVTTLPEALAAAAGQLQTIGTTLAAENAAAAAPTTGVVPAAADQVSALQATQFAAYGTWYQQVSAQAQAVHEMFVNTLGTSAGSYGATEAANTAAAGSPMSGLSGLLGGLTASASDPPGSGRLLGGLTTFLQNSPLNSNVANLLNIQAGNWGSAASDLIAMAGGGLLTPVPSGAGAAGGELGAGLAGSLDGTVLAGAAGPPSAGLGAAPVLASVGQASSVGGLSVPPSWAGEAVPVSSAAPATLVGAGWTTAAPEGTPVATVPAGMPAVATAGKAAGLGAPRYGVKPNVMPKPVVV